jgi:hypothetical protein
MKNYFSKRPLNCIGRFGELPPRLYHTLDSLLNPYVFMITRIYSTRMPMLRRCDSHKEYVRAILTMPLDRVENEVEVYFSGLYSHIFRRSSTFSGAQD